MSFAVAVRGDGAAVQLHDGADDREPEPEPSHRAREPRVGLPKAVENVGQKGRMDAASVIGDDQLRMVIARAAPAPAPCRPEA